MSASRRDGCPRRPLSQRLCLQGAPMDLAAGQERKLRQRDDPARPCERRQAPEAKQAQLVRESRARSRQHQGIDCLFAVRGGDRMGDGIAHLGVAPQDSLDLAKVQAMAAQLDELIPAPEQAKWTVIAHDPEIIRRRSDVPAFPLRVQCGRSGNVARAGPNRGTRLGSQRSGTLLGGNAGQAERIPFRSTSTQARPRREDQAEGR